MGRRLASNHEPHHSKLVLLDWLFQSYTEDLPTLRRTLARSDMMMMLEERKVGFTENTKCWKRRGRGTNTLRFWVPFLPPANTGNQKKIHSSK